MAVCSRSLRWAAVPLIVATLTLALLSAPADALARPSIGVPSNPCACKTVSRCAVELEGTRLSHDEAACLIGAGVGLFGGVVGGIIGAATARGIVGAAVGGSAAGCLGRMLP
jgi:hypothetical protein